MQDPANLLNVKIVHLPPAYAASAYGFGPSPEEVAHRKIVAFLEKRGLLAGYGVTYPCYGFNNPSPSPDNPNYGYEILVPVPESTQPDGDIRIVFFPGGPYAVTRFENLENITPTWMKLLEWRERSLYKAAYHIGFEHLLNPLEPDMSKSIFDLYLPIGE